jgi:nitrite reductase/ring-hydroxylating ferredoxin subunit
MRLVTVARLSQLPPGGLLRADLEGRPLALARVDGEVHAVSDTCTHEEASLSEGFLDDHELECPLHGALFDVRDGRAKTLPATRDLEAFPVRVEGDSIMIEIADSENG